MSWLGVNRRTYGTALGLVSICDGGYGLWPRARSLLLPYMRRVMGILATVASLFGIGCGKSTSTRYRMATDPGSRYSFRYVYDKVSGRWIYREFELRVDTTRPLPDPISDSENGDRLSLQLFRPGTAQTGGLRSGTPVIEGGFRIWRGADVSDESDLEGQAAYGVTVAWPVVDDTSGAPHDALEIFQLPPFGETEPGTWSEWATAAKLREGGFGWWEEVHGKPGDSAPPPPRYPFEFRWKLVLNEVPGRIP